jgi:thiol-disulfide isomerase/thioredoxin
MALELSLRATIGLLLLGACTLGACDRQSQGAQQANDAAANVSTPEPGASGEPGNFTQLPAATLAEKLDRSHKGEAGPSFGFTDPAGKKVTLAAYKGKPVLLNLWATWCAPCLKEMPTLDRLAARKGDALQVIALSQDLGGSDAVKPFFARSGFKALKPWIDSDAAFSTGAGLNLPTTVLYDSQGKEVWRIAGDADWTSAEIATLLAEAS